MSHRTPLTTEPAAPVLTNQSSQTGGPNGPTLLQDHHLTGKVARFNGEGIPERSDVQHTEALLKTGALRSAIFNSANLSASRSARLGQAAWSRR
jgi:catalase